MPRFIRPSWIEVFIDGKKPLKGGPSAKDGGLHMILKVRKEGEVFPLLEIYCKPKDGKQFVQVFYFPTNGILYEEEFPL